MLMLLLAQVFYGSGTPPTKLRPLFTGDDFPVAARGKNIQGSVQAELTVNERGAVAVCKIIKSSGHAILDETTCKIIIERAAFKPDKDTSGRPVTGTVQTPVITWSEE